MLELQYPRPTLRKLKLRAQISSPAALVPPGLRLRDAIDRGSICGEIVGSSKALRRILAQVTKVAPVDATVLITGETGTGKELLARAIHAKSNRSARAFIRVNCAAIPRSLIASELFGHALGEWVSEQ
jgi:formate hydrogenlyase transcriptional activator